MPRLVRTKKPDTIEAVAEAAGVSVMTVSRVMRGKDNVAASTRARVEEAAQRIGYVPNRLASSLASSRSLQIGVIVPSLRNYVFPEVLAGITDRLDATDYQAVVGITDYDLEREGKLVESMLSWRPAAIMLANATHDESTRLRLNRARVPVVELMEQTEAPIDMNVGIDQHEVGAVMAGHLLAAGYRRFTYLGTDHDTDFAAAKRYRGFVDKISGEGGEMVRTITATEPSSIGLGRDNIGRLLSRRTEFDVIYCSNDAVAVGAMLACLGEGIDIPGEVAIAGFGGFEIASAMPIPLTTIRSPRYEMGRISAQLVLDRLAGDSTAEVEQPRFEVVPGAST